MPGPDDGDLEEQLSEPRPAHSLPSFWAVQYLCFPPGPEREEARRATAINYCVSGDGPVKDFEAKFAQVLRCLERGPAMTAQLVPPIAKAPDDGSG